MKKFTRFIKLIGEDKFTELTKKTVMVIGLGGVGGYALESLVRSGISNIIIVDFDTIDISNINRQIIALNNNIGRKKVDISEERIKLINPKCNVQKFDIKVDENNIDMLFDCQIDYLIDAIDDVKAKQLIIKKCLDKKIKFISSMGTGNKFDPSKLEIIDIRKTTHDKLAKVIRKWVIDNKIKDKILVVSSKEECKKIDNVIGSTSYVPASAGLLLASYVINDIRKE